MLIKAHLLTVAVSILIPVFHVFLIRIFKRPDKSIAFMFTVFATYLTIMLFVYNSCGLKSLMIGPLALSVTICLVYMELFSMLCRGFSLAIIMVVFEKGPIDIKRICNLYSAGRGMHWMIEKRIDSIERLGLVKREGESLRVHSLAGILVGQAARLYKNLLRIGPGGT